MAEWRLIWALPTPQRSGTNLHTCLRQRLARGDARLVSNGWNEPTYHRHSRYEDRLNGALQHRRYDVCTACGFAAGLMFWYGHWCLFDWEWYPTYVIHCDFTDSFVSQPQGRYRLLHVQVQTFIISGNQTLRIMSNISKIFIWINKLVNLSNLTID